MVSGDRFLIEFGEFISITCPTDGAHSITLAIPHPTIFLIFIKSKEERRI